MPFKINRVYTRSGDDGETSLVGGTRVKKNHARVVAYGTVDELNAILGLAKEAAFDFPGLQQELERLQQELFDIGSELATEKSYEGMWQVSEKDVTRIERLCDAFGEDLPELESFILPGGSTLSSYFHLARTVARRAERDVVSLLEVETDLNKELLVYLNRISDLFFVLSRRVLSDEGKSPPLWVPASRRES